MTYLCVSDNKPIVMDHFCLCLARGGPLFFQGGYISHFAITLMEYLNKKPLREEWVCFWVTIIPEGECLSGQGRQGGRIMGPNWQMGREREGGEGRGMRDEGREGGRERTHWHFPSLCTS